MYGMTVIHKCHLFKPHNALELRAVSQISLDRLDEVMLTALFYRYRQPAVLCQETCTARCQHQRFAHNYDDVFISLSLEWKSTYNTM